ncbi:MULTISPECIES: phosphotransferase family protein [unclassified Oceanobacillus]|uniref:phosphotransferase family protein n=1 Tax=unclassified Oceanobacillus TaxID=2630292 RepID=UPI001BEA2BEE|nr:MULTISPECIES: phosphotransferase family protein [unclassified Oceanobacillus]MBT2600642.1 phosphotransferase family protein [Oceanobacillus sp. ISL-74]MBT2650961.1 phosphotransferase family protein [Oceanobacillus sp. ISL-73]
MAAETIPVRRGEEIDQRALEDFLREKLTDLPNGTLTMKQFSAGRSNLTYLLKVGNWEAVLRRPPLGPVAPKAHDMGREFSILKEIQAHFSPAPRAYIYGDENVIGSPFFVMERKKGIVLDTDFPEETQVTDDLCRKVSENMVDTLVELHQIDYSHTNLVNFTKPQGFLERQVHGWIKRYDRAKTDDINGVEQLKSWLMKHIPNSSETTIIHYDYKLNNLMFNEDFSEIVGLFDWEMTTVGDPLADLGVAMSYWTEAIDSPLLKKGLDDKEVTTKYSGFLTRNDWIESYSKKSGRDVSNIHFYLTFAYFKLAVICQQIYYRWFQGQTNDERFKDLNGYVRNLITFALENTHKKI